VCGSFAGAVQALVICPTEHVKCRLQIQNNIGYTENKLFRGPFDALYQIVHGHGVRGLYRGFVCTTWREVPAFGLYFSAYDYIKDTVSNALASSSMIGTSTTTSSSSVSNQDMDISLTTKNTLHTWAASSLAGGLSGALTWAIIYPFDVIKTRIQTSSLDTPI
jgi:solute carrier family 25 carnitine/acylcarnitine transporter 20/29